MGHGGPGGEAPWSHTGGTSEHSVQRTAARIQKKSSCGRVNTVYVLRTQEHKPHDAHTPMIAMLPNKQCRMCVCVGQPKTSAQPRSSPEQCARILRHARCCAYFPRLAISRRANHGGRGAHGHWHSPPDGARHRWRDANGWRDVRHRSRDANGDGRSTPIERRPREQP